MEPSSTPMAPTKPAPKLSAAQTKALYKFSGSGGHGYGEYAYLPRSTARALAKMGLVRLGWVRTTGLGGQRRSMPWGLATAAGMAVLNSMQRHVSELPMEPYGWSPASEGWLPGSTK